MYIYIYIYIYVYTYIYIYIERERVGAAAEPTQSYLRGGRRVLLAEILWPRIARQGTVYLSQIRR